MSELVDALGQPHVQLLLRLLLGGLLLLAGLTKLVDRGGFRQAVAEYDVLPKALERPFATLLPWAEASLGVLLLLGLGTTVAASIATPLFLGFGIAISLNLLRGRDIDCHCFGSMHSERIGAPALVRSLALALAALAVALGASRFGALDAVWLGAPSGLPPVSEVIPIVFLAAVIFDMLILLPETINVWDGFSRRQAAHSGALHANGHRPTGAEARSTT